MYACIHACTYPNIAVCIAMWLATHLVMHIMDFKNYNLVIVLCYLKVASYMPKMLAMHYA